MKNVLLDTSIVQYYLQNDQQVVLSFGMHLARGGKAYISRWSYMQINAWLASEGDEGSRGRFFDMMRRMGIVEVSEGTSRLASVRNQLSRKGRSVDEGSLLNVGVAMAEGLAFVTEEESQLHRAVKGLEVKNWA